MLAAFLNDAQTASMIGYTCSIGFTLAAGTFVMCGGVYDRVTGEMESMYYPFPMFPYTRICFLLSDFCTWSRCIQNWNEYPDEVFACLKAIYVDSVWILVVALYLN